MSDESVQKISREDILRMAAEIVAAYVSHNSLPAAGVPEVIGTVFRSLNALDGSGAEEQTEAQKPAVSIKRSIANDYIVCLEDGKKLKMLKRHLMTRYGMTPDDYRTKWGLPGDYPMVAPNYAKKRSQLAKNMGLGQQGKAAQAREAQAREAQAHEAKAR